MRLWRQHFWGGSREKVAEVLQMSVRKLQCVELGTLDLTLAEALLLRKWTSLREVREKAADYGFKLPIVPDDWEEHLRGLEKCA
jgi:hypothetical protein